jgi:hypothetical protein
MSKGSVLGWMGLLLLSVGPLWGVEYDEEGWITLFNGKDLSGWHLRHKGTNTWRAEDGVLRNTQRGVDLVSDEVFWDFELHIEFNVPRGSNSGVYLQGRYEIQVDDAYGARPNSHRCGGIYGKITPKQNAAKPAGEWQTFDVKFYSARLGPDGKVVKKARVTVYHNGVLIIDNAEIDGVTGGALDGREGLPGPIMLQGDHGPIFYRNIRIRPLWEGNEGWRWLFNGKDMTNWHLRHPGGRNGWTVENGQLVNIPPSTDIVTDSVFQDFDLHIEFLIPPRSNSGVYLQGRYEIQIDDAYGARPDSHRCGGIYGRITPRVIAARPPGQWQSFDVHFVAARRDERGNIVRKARVTVYHNGVLIIDNAEIDGVTGGALDPREGLPGPLMLQGDHGPIRYRNIYIRPL